jgi:PAS domain S-box-containing protein
VNPVHEKESLIHENRELRQRLAQLEERLAQCREAKRRLEDEYNLSSKLLNTIGALIVVLDREGHIIRFNKASETATGYTFAEVKNRPFWDIFLTPAEKDEVKALFNRLLSGDWPIINENHWVTKDGRSRLFAWSFTALVRNGRAEFFIKTGFDLTEREQVAKFIQHLASFSQLNPEPILELDLSGQITYYNDATLKTLTGLGSSSQVEAFLPADLQQIIQEAQTSGTNFFEREVVIGNSVFAEAISFPAELKVVRLYVRDITKRKKAENLLRQSEEKLARAEAVAHLGHWELDLKTNKLTWSREVFRMFRRDPAAFVPTFDAFVAAIHPDDRQQLLDIRNAALQEGTCFFIDYRIVFAHTERVLHERVEIIRDEAGHPFRIFSTIQDITAHKEAEEALSKNYQELQEITQRLEQSRNMLQLIIESIPVRVFWKDKNLHYLGCNTMFARDAGFSRPEELLGRDDYDMPWGEQAQLYQTDDRQVMESGLPKINIMEPLITSTGDQIWLNTSKVPLRQPNGEVGVLGVYEDITARKQAEAERADLEKQYLQAQKLESLGRLAGGVAHDFNNMLAVILGYTEVALMELGPQQSMRKNLEEVKSAAQRSADLVSHLLAFARKQIIIPKILNLNDTVSNLLKILRRLIGEDIELIWKPGRDLWNVLIDPSQIDQILANLLVNARDAIAGVGNVAIETANMSLDENYCADHAECLPGNYVLLATSDDGCGMDREILAHIFEPFFTTKGPGKGTGLGLATVYGIVKQNSGLINVYSEPGKGTTFRIYLPRHQAEAVAVQAEMPRAVPEGGSETVLLVEDEEMMLALGKASLERLGYTVLAARTPEEAIRLAREQAGKIDLLLTDVVMPEMNGRELAARLTSEQPGLKCLYMSGYTADVIALRGLLTEGLQFLQKPFTLSDLAKKLRKALEQ